MGNDNKQYADDAIDLAIDAIKQACAETASECNEILRSKIDFLLNHKTNSDKPALLFLLAYQKVRPSWDMRRVPPSWRPGDKKLCTELTEMSLTLHGNITSYGENMGIKGDASGYDFFERRPNLGAVLREVDDNPSSLDGGLAYLAYRFKKSYKKLEIHLEENSSGFVFCNMMKLIDDLLRVPSNGHFPQFLIASLLEALYEQLRVDYRVITHHPNASDKSDNCAGDVEVFSDGNLNEAYEVTVRPDWANRTQDLLKKMAKFQLKQYTVLCVARDNIDLTSTDGQKKLFGKLGQDIAVVDLHSFCYTLNGMLSLRGRQRCTEILREYLLNKKLCGVPALIEKANLIFRDNLEV